jgi:murein DD-endopeptidase MepM/ murein hydrolase activator NlpD
LNFSTLAKLRSVVGILLTVAAAFGSQAALANSAATADIAAPLRAAQAAKQSALGNGDEEFKQLFSSWRSLDKPQLVSVSKAPMPTGAIGVPQARMPGTLAVSIPSRIPLEGYHFTSGFGMRVHPVLGGRRQHKGIDLAAPMGTPVYAAANGEVSKAEWFSGYGLYVALEHGADIQTRYGHMSRLNVAAGQMVHKGDLIGYVGSTGRSTGPHLHYEVRVAGEAVNPMPYMQTGEMLAAADAGGLAIGGGD